MNLITFLRTPKIFDMAIFDWVMTFAGAYFFHKYMKIKCSIWSVFILFVIIGIAVHIVTDTPTMFNYYLGLSKKPIRSK